MVKVYEDLSNLQKNYFYSLICLALPIQKPIYTSVTYHYYDNTNDDEVFSFIRWQSENENKVFKMKIMHVQSVLPEEDIIALKMKTGEPSTKDAISKAVYYYLDCPEAE